VPVVHRQVGGSGGHHAYTNDDEFIIGTDIDHINVDVLDDETANFTD
jgi:hypothetical protein